MGIEQHPWTPPSWCQEHSQYVNYRCPQMAQCPPGTGLPWVRSREDSSHSREAGMLYQHVINIGEQ